MTEFPEGAIKDWSALFALGASNEGLNIRALISRQPKLCTRLEKFDALDLIQTLSGLLTQLENHAATLRIEALIHLAAACCRGIQKATHAHIRGWLNDVLLSDPLGRGEDPVEDVFASIVPSWGGGVVLLEGAWTDNAYYLQNLMAALLRLDGEPWAKAAFHHVMALLLLAREVAIRAGVRRYSMSSTVPGAKILVAADNVEAGRAAVRFTLNDLFGFNVIARDISPFVLSPEDWKDGARDSLGNSALERRPLLRQGNDWVVALPTAIGAAARRFVLEFAEAEHALAQLDDALQAVEFQDIQAFLLSNWEFEKRSVPTKLNKRLTAVTAQFGEGAYALIVHVADDLSETLDTGLQGIDILLGRLKSVISPLEVELASKPDYRHGLTVILHGGLGRGHVIDFDRAPSEWHRLDLSLGDALRMGWDGDFTAKRIWKILSQQNELPSRGFEIGNINGFLNLYGYLQTRNFEPVPSELAPGGMAILTTEYVGLARHRIRAAIDYHLVLAPNGRSLVEVQRRSAKSYFKEVSELPLFVSPVDALNGRLLAVVETVQRPWWVDHTAGPHGTGQLTAKVWDAAQKWLVRLATLLEQELRDLPSGPISILLEFSDLEDLSELAVVSTGEIARPNIRLDHGVIKIDSTILALCGYIHETNIAERYLIAAIALATCELANSPKSTEWADELAVKITGSTDARFVHAIPANDIPQIVQATIPLPKPQFQMDEDRAWTDLGLAKLAGATRAGIVPETEVGPLLRTAVLRLWEKIRERLLYIDRRSLVVKALLNHEAVDRDRSEWAQTAAALLALHDDSADVLLTQNEQEARRSSAGVASRALAEMALCACPTDRASPCTDIEFDQLLSEVCAMVDCATQCDAYFYRLATGPLRVTANGCFFFDTGFLEQLHQPYMHAHGDRAFHDAAEGYADAFNNLLSDTDEALAAEIDPDLVKALRVEFGMSFQDLVALSHAVAEHALESGKAYVALTRSEFHAILEKLGPDVDVKRAYVALTLRPRQTWDEQEPVGATSRDWQPWRMSRKLSLTRRPIVQLDENEDPEILLFPVLIARFVRRMFELIDGRLGAEIFDTKEIDRWIGKIANERGHTFNHSVAERLSELGLDARPDQLMTLFGASKEYGDIDVLAWTKEGIVWIIECKRLLLDRTVGEVGERLADYTTRGRRNGKRTPIQKHLDRIAFFEGNLSRLSRFTGIDQTKIVLRSALVTDGIVPMQFAESMAALVDVATDFRNIADALTGQRD
ncbi:hypothetical protein [Agrobacterium sp. CG674]